MPDSTGFGDYTETGQVIAVRFKTKDGTLQEGGYVHAMYLDDNAPIAGRREIWGFPKKLASPKVSHESETVVCTLHYGSVLCVCATMAANTASSTRAAVTSARAAILYDQDYPARRLHAADLRTGLLLPRGRHAQGRLVRPGRDPAFRARMCDVARLPVREAVGATHYVTDLTLGLGEVVFDYLNDA